MSFRRTDPPGRDEVDGWFAELRSVRCVDLQELLAKGETPTIVDVRTEGETRARRIPGARLIPLHEFEDRIEELLALPGPLYVHCEHGVRSVDACLLLKWQGRDDVVNVVEGLCAWRGTTESG
jgi:rhodanese-related sulfurtransferase